MANKQDATTAWAGVRFIWGWIWAIAKFITGAALLFLVASMAAKGAGVPFVTWRTLPIDQNTGVGLAAMAYVLGRV